MKYIRLSRTDMVARFLLKGECSKWVYTHYLNDVTNAWEAFTQLPDKRSALVVTEAGEVGFADSADFPFSFKFLTEEEYFLEVL